MLLYTARDRRMSAAGHEKAQPVLRLISADSSQSVSLFLAPGEYM